MQNQRKISQFEFVALMASMMSIVALGIDALLPALSNIGEAIHSLDPTDNQLLVTMIFLGLGVGQLFFGPLSDSFGRKPIVYLGFAVFLVGSIISIFSKSLEVMVVGRILQGVGLSAPRTITISIIRDLYSGDRMARVMSFITAFFILVPVVAPALGKLILDAFGWKAIFYFQLLFAAVIIFWFYRRQVETLKPEYKVPFTGHLFADGLKELLKYPDAILYTLVSGLITGSFLVYLSSAQHVFENLYGLREAFPYIFAGLAISIGVSTFMNGAMVLRFGMRKLAFTALVAFTCVGLAYVLIFWGKPNPSVYVLVAFLSAQFFCLGFVWGNLRSLAMEPIGHIAGIGAAITGFISTMISIPIASFVGRFLNDNVWPLFLGLVVCGALSVCIFKIQGRNGMLTAKN
ncbi:MAG: multidrug effflux MFS transporter [Flavobacteriaceae bacterium]